MKTALEHHFEHVEERKQSKMQTLGASNPHNNNKDKHRQNTKVTGDTVDQIFSPGKYNQLFPKHKNPLFREIFSRNVPPHGLLKIIFLIYRRE